MKKGIAGEAMIIIAGLFLSFALQARGDATVYWDYDNGFSPSTAVIGPGETVTWWNFDPYGFDVRVTFNGGYSFALRNLHGQGVIFPAQTGTYNYHSDFNDFGVVIVKLPPSITITNPLNHAVLSAPATFTIGAKATDSTGISQVEFFLDSGAGPESLGVAYDVPYSASVINLPVGDYTITATANDNYGSQSSDSINITVSVGTAITLLAPRVSAGQFLFDVAGLTVGKTNILQASTNLTSWTAIKTNIAANASVTITNASVTGRRFFRILQLP